MESPLIQMEELIRFGIDFTNLNRTLRNILEKEKKHEKEILALKLLVNDKNSKQKPENLQKIEYEMSILSENLSSALGRIENLENKVTDLNINTELKLTEIRELLESNVSKLNGDFQNKFNEIYETSYDNFAKFTELIQKNEENISNLNDKIKDLQLLISDLDTNPQIALNYEKKFEEVEEKINNAISSKSKEEKSLEEEIENIKKNNPGIKNDILVELNTKYLSVLNESNKFRELIRNMNDLPKESNLELFSSYIPYVTRISKIEEELKNVQSKILNNESIVKDNFYEKNKHFGMLRQLSLREKIIEQKEIVEKGSEKESPSNEEKFFEEISKINSILENILTILPDKLSRSDFELILSQSLADKGNMIPEKIKLLENRLKKAWYKVRNKFMPTNKSKEDDLDLNLSDIDSENFSKIIEILNKKIQHSLNIPKISEIKLQELTKDIQDLQEKYQNLQKSIQEIEKTLSKNTKIKKIDHEKSEEYLKELEDLRENVQDILKKIHEGSKLHKRDYGALQELKRLLESKTSKEEIENKVDKVELKKMMRLLSKKVKFI